MVKVKREAYIPHSGDITCSSMVSRRVLELFGSAVTQKKSAVYAVSISAWSFLKGFLTNSQLITVLISLCNVLITRSFSAFDLARLSAGEGFLW